MMTEPNVEAVDEPAGDPSVRRPPRPALHFAQGLMMGTADVIPGISGGTIALIVGIYERLIEAVRSVTGLPIALRHGVREAFGQVEWRFVIPLGIGIVTAIGVGARLIPPVMEAFPEESRALFFGLVAASLIVPWQRAGRVRGGAFLLAAAAAAVAFVLVGLPALSAPDPSYLRVFASAAVAICAMILPGVSGAFLLTVLGIYEASLEAISAADLAYVGVFILGAITGLALFARLLSYLLRHFYTRTMVVLVGLLAGSLRALWPWQGEALVGGELVSTPAHLLVPPSLEAAAIATAVGAVGFGMVAVLIWLGRRREKPQADNA